MATKRPIPVPWGVEPVVTFKCPECEKAFDFSLNFKPEGCMLMEKCPSCHAYVALTSDNIIDPNTGGQSEIDPQPGNP